MAKVYNLKMDRETKNNYYNPRGYLGAKIGKFNLPDDSDTTWLISGYGYIK